MARVPSTGGASWELLDGPPDGTTLRLIALTFLSLIALYIVIAAAVYALSTSLPALIKVIWLKPQQAMMAPPIAKAEGESKDSSRA